MISSWFPWSIFTVILFDFPVVFDTIRYSFLFDTSFSLTLWNSYFPLILLFWLLLSEHPNYGAVAPVLMSSLFVPICWVILCTFMVSVTISAQDSWVHTPTLYCPSELLTRPANLQVPMSTWMPQRHPKLCLAKENPSFLHQIIFPLLSLTYRYNEQRRERLRFLSPLFVCLFVCFLRLNQAKYQPWGFFWQS